MDVSDLCFNSVKLRRGGNSQNFCVHKYFYENSPYWKNIRTEEEAGNQEGSQPVASGSGEVELEEGADENFTPIDSRHLTSLSLLRSRIVKLLKQSPNHMHIFEDISLKIVRYFHIEDAVSIYLILYRDTRHGLGPTDDFSSRVWEN